MSIAGDEFAEQEAEQNRTAQQQLQAQHAELDPGEEEPAKRKKVQTPYRPFLSTIVRQALEVLVEESLTAHELIDLVERWLVAEHVARDHFEAIVLRATNFDELRNSMLDEDKESLKRVSRLDNVILRLAQRINKIERTSSTTLQRALRSRPSPAER